MLYFVACLNNPIDKSPKIVDPYDDMEEKEQNVTENENKEETDIEEPIENEENSNSEMEEEVEERTEESEIEEPSENSNGLGVWLWYIEGTGYTHETLAQKLQELGVSIVYVKVADGAASCSSWPELCDTSIPEIYAAYGIEAWAWSYNYPSNETAQASALTQAYETGYHGYVMDIESEFNHDEENLERIMQEFFLAKSAIAPTDWELRVTTWGNPMDHGMRVDIIDQYVNAHMPQTYLEVWGNTYMNNADYWVRYGTCEYRHLGAQKPVYHIFSTENDVISSEILQSAIAASGSFSSLWRVPGEGTPMSIWQTWENIQWDVDLSADIEEDCSIFP